MKTFIVVGDLRKIVSECIPLIQKDIDDALKEMKSIEKDGATYKVDKKWMTLKSCTDGAVEILNYLKKLKSKIFILKDDTYLELSDEELNYLSYIEKIKS